MEFESPDVEKDFPGLYASESGRRSNESDFSEGDHSKLSKKDILGRRKDKKEKKDRGYAALGGESSPEEDTDTKSPSRSKKTKSFKFPSKSKDKREKSRDKEKVLEEAVKQKELIEKEKKRDKYREKKEKYEEKREKLKDRDKEKEERAKFKLESKDKLRDEKKEKIKDKDKEKIKDKDKKIFEKDKDKKDKKLTKVSSTVTSGVPFEEIFTLGVAFPIFGVPLQQSVERSPCHDDTFLPLVVRDSIDYLQMNLNSSLIYRSDADKIKLQQLRKLYTDRCPTFSYHWDVPVACAILKSFISELPDSILTRELHEHFEQATAITESQNDSMMVALISKLPRCNYSLLSWLMRHFKSVVDNQQVNHANIQTIATVMGPALNMSLNLLTLFITKADIFFPDVQLTKYLPPLQSLPAEFPDSAPVISAELRKQESLLNQLHAEIHAGFITQSRDQQLWEAQRIVTQLKRKLRSVQKSVEPSNVSSVLPQQHSENEKPAGQEQAQNGLLLEEMITQSICVTPPKYEPANNSTNTRLIPEVQEYIPAIPSITYASLKTEFEDKFDIKTDNVETPVVSEPLSETVQDKHKFTEEELKALRLELENAEYLQLKSLLQAKINSEQFEIVKLKSQFALKNKQEAYLNNTKYMKEHNSEEYELRLRLMNENAELEQKRLNLINQIFHERVDCIQLKIKLAMKEILFKLSKMYSSLTACRRALFTKLSRTIECLPPTEDALLELMKRASLQAQIWRQALEPQQQQPSPADWGWERDPSGSWTPKWRNIPVAADSCNAFVRCKCKKPCGGNCSCKRKGFSCRELCSCSCDTASRKITEVSKYIQ